ncbi:hypothetical protein CHUAL_010257 [Chamberlinius hualienensis]
MAIFHCFLLKFNQHFPYESCSVGEMLRDERGGGVQRVWGHCWFLSFVPPRFYCGQSVVPASGGLWGRVSQRAACVLWKFGPWNSLETYTRPWTLLQLLSRKLRNNMHTNTTKDAIQPLHTRKDHKSSFALLVTTYEIGDHDTLKSHGQFPVRQLPPFVQKTGLDHSLKKKGGRSATGNHTNTPAVDSGILPKRKGRGRPIKAHTKEQQHTAVKSKPAGTSNIKFNQTPAGNTRSKKKLQSN